MYENAYILHLAVHACYMYYVDLKHDHNSLIYTYVMYIYSVYSFVIFCASSYHFLICYSMKHYVMFLNKFLIWFFGFIN